MKRTRLSVARTAALAVAAATALLPTLTSATPASASTPTCEGTSLINGQYSGHQIRIPTVGNATPNQWACQLAEGNSGPAVARLQIDINDCYGNLLPNGDITVDGIFGPDTKAALIVAQNAGTSTPDGIYGPKTAHSFTYQESGQPTGLCDFNPQA
jgi:peptidoglycan hydrolase-like protein with peptidoglycan-binding domain